MNPVVVKILISLLIKLLEMIKAQYDSMTPEQKQQLADAIAAMPPEGTNSGVNSGFPEP